ncbi:HD family phosphohydrolase [Tundrisphaera sp. TA3]|uniref:HD family phosphohydrolase n=1 Tax=Tundrisphaera sp. TA3 TaxID=3435775 RepID=UPI003EB83151
MSFGKRRPKLTRAHLRPSNPIAIRQGRLAQQRGRLARLAVVAAAVLVTAAIVHGPGPFFTYRHGQVPDREIRVKVPEFRRFNQSKTSAERQARADQVPPTMVNDPAPIRDLADRLDDLVDAIAKAPTFAAVPEAFRNFWKLTQYTYDDIREASDTPERHEELRRKIVAAFEPLIRDGVLGPDILPRNEDASRTLSVRRGDVEYLVPRDRVMRERIDKPDGPVGRDFIATFLPNTLGQGLFALVADKLAGTPTLKYDANTTARRRQEARDQVADAYDTFSKGDVLVEQGQKIGDDQLTLLRAEHQIANASRALEERLRRGCAVVILSAALFALIGYYVYRHEPRIAQDIGRIASICTLCVAAIGLARLLAMQPWDAELVPVAIAAMILAIAYNPNFALMVTFGLCLLTTLATNGSIGSFITLMGGTAVGVLCLHEVRTRTKLIKVGVACALGYGLLTWASGLWGGQPIELVIAESLARAGWGLMAGFVLGGSLPFVETAFGIVTGISLLELGDIAHPLLQELVRRAPGTHNHSIAVGTIAEAAAERIGANSLLVRIGAYFHDIGKMLKPHYFVENQAGATNRHANLAPAMSTLIIIGHVKDGVDLGRQHHLPEPIIDLIEQHHGTTLVEYFFHEATRRSGGNPDGATVLEGAFRYPGPKPQSKEAALLMVSDAVESASRTLSEPTPARIEGLVRDLINKRLHDGQFDECGLTLREISEIRESLIKSLIGIYHGRVKYPEQRTA